VNVPLEVAEGGSFVASLLLLGLQVGERERVVEGQLLELACNRLGHDQVPALDRSPKWTARQEVCLGEHVDGPACLRWPAAQKKRA
jgi:hypothetical protein